jgi:hypothetical protein
MKTYMHLLDQCNSTSRGNWRIDKTKLGDSPHVFKNINIYPVTLYDDEKLSFKATIRKFRIVQTEGNRQVSRLVDPDKNRGQSPGFQNRK